MLKVLGVGQQPWKCQPGNLLNVQKPRPLPPTRMETRIQWGWASESPVSLWQQVVWDSILRGHVASSVKSR